LRTLSDNVILKAEGAIVLKNLSSVNNNTIVIAGANICIYKLKYLPHKYSLFYGKILVSENIRLKRIKNKQYITNIYI
jgi:hypothetical protein